MYVPAAKWSFLNSEMVKKPYSVIFMGDMSESMLQTAKHMSQETAVIMDDVIRRDNRSKRSYMLIIDYRRTG